MVFVHIEFTEDLLETLLSQELLLVHAHHHELVERDFAITRAISHRNQLIDPLLVEIGTKMLPVTIDEFFSGERAVARSVQILENLLQLYSVIHVQKVLNQVSKGSLFGYILAGE